MKFKIGDKVITKDSGCGSCSALKHDRDTEKGETGIVTGIHSDRVEILLDKDGKYATRMEEFLKFYGNTYKFLL